MGATVPPAEGALDEGQYHFIHSIDLPGLGYRQGQWDLRGRFDEYVGGEPIGVGTTLLDVGAATGFLSFEAERRGAAVTSFDADSVDRWSRVPFTTTLYSADRARWRAVRSAELDAIKRSYWLCHKLLGSRARMIYGDVYEIGPHLGRFDVVLMGQILVHLRDALSALEAAASVCEDRMIIVEGSFESDEPTARFLPDPSQTTLDVAFYHYSRLWYERVLAILGFRSVKFSTARYRCYHAMHARDIALTTIVARRSP